MYRSYIIFDIQEINKINFLEIEETSIETLTLSADSSKTYVKWETEFIPESVNNLITKEGPYTHEEMLNILTSSFWT